MCPNLGPSCRGAERFHPAVTARLLLDASQHIASGKPIALVDGGVENFNEAVARARADRDPLLELIDRIPVGVAR